MQLSYRGAKYQNFNSIAEIHRLERSGIYRGATWHKPPLASTLVPTAITRLKYRGVSYLHS